MENDRNAKRMYVGEYVGSCSVDWPLKRWINSVNDWLKKKKGLYVRQVKRMLSDRSEYWPFVRGNAWGVALGNEPLTLARCHSCGLPHLYEALEGWTSVCGRAYN